MGSQTEMLMKSFNLAARVHKTHIIITGPRFSLEMQTENFLFRATTKKYNSQHQQVLRRSYLQAIKTYKLAAY